MAGSPTVPIENCPVVYGQQSFLIYEANFAETGYHLMKCEQETVIDSFFFCANVAEAGALTCQLVSFASGTDPNSGTAMTSNVAAITADTEAEGAPILTANVVPAGSWIGLKFEDSGTEQIDYMALTIRFHTKSSSGQTVPGESLRV